jgi:carboxyl-terminal processing protease
VAIGTEGLGAQRFHGRIAMLVNEHTASAAEIVVAFARENELATVIGVKTAGRLIGAKSFKVGAGYRVALPVVAFRTWQDKMIEGCGVEPTVHIPMNPEDLVGGRDPQLQHAFTFLN